MGVAAGVQRSVKHLGIAPRMEQRMDKKAKKRLEVINKKLQTLRPRLAGSKAQADDPDELKQLQDEIAKLEAEAAELKASK